VSFPGDIAPKYRAFICYSQQDRKTAEALHRRLEGYRVPKYLVGRESPSGPVPARLAPIFRDCDELAVSADIGTALREALIQSRFLIVLCSPAAARSRWVNAEIEIFRAHRVENEHRILCVLLSGEPASPISEECFPPSLRKDESASAMPRFYPLAADFRPGREHRENEQLRLIATLLDVGFDELKRRNHAQRLRGLRRALAMAVLLVIGFASLAIFAFTQRAQARRSAARAIRARNEAEKLVDFMVTDLRAKLEALGKLSLLEPANEQVRRYYETVASEEENAETLHHRGMALAERGDDLLAKGDAREAIEFYQAARTIRERLVNLEPEQIQWRRYLAEIYGRLADAARIQNDLPTALAEQTVALSILRALIEAHPESVELEHDTAAATTQLGYLHIQLGRTDLAEEEFQSALAMFERILSNFSSIDRNFDVITALAQLGDTFRKTGKGRKAEALFRRAIFLGEETLRSEPENVKLVEQFQLSHSLLSQVLAEGTRLSEALAEQKVSLALNRRLVLLEPQNVRYQRRVSILCVQIGEALCQQSMYADAEPYIREALTISEELAAHYPNDKSCETDLPTNLNHLASLLIDSNRFEEALPENERAVDIRRRICAEDPSNREMKHWLGYDIHCLGQNLLRLKRFAEARNCVIESIAIANELVSADPANLVPLQFRALYELELGVVLQEEGKLHEAKKIYEQCLRTVALYVEKGGSPTAIHFPKEEAERALKNLNSRARAK
jgi:tetratricopeptide (TPR) repeat protein